MRLNFITASQSFRFWPDHETQREQAFNFEPWTMNKIRKPQFIQLLRENIRYSAPLLGEF